MHVLEWEARKRADEVRELQKVTPACTPFILPLITALMPPLTPHGNLINTTLPCILTRFSALLPLVPFRLVAGSLRCPQLSVR